MRNEIFFWIAMIFILSVVYDFLRLEKLRSLPQTYSKKYVIVDKVFSDSNDCYIVSGRDTINGKLFRDSDFCKLKVGNAVELYYREIQ
jgi:hypothetical protein